LNKNSPTNKYLNTTKTNTTALLKEQKEKTIRNWNRTSLNEKLKLTLRMIFLRIVLNPVISL